MVYELSDTLCAEDGESSIAQESTPSGQSSPVFLLSNSMCSEMSLPMLAAHCLRELDNYRRGAPAKDMYGIELFRRATIQATRRPGSGCTTALAGWYEAGCVVIPTERRHVAWTAKRTMWRWRLNASGSPPPQIYGWHSVRWLLPCSTCVRVCMGLSWIRYGPMGGHEKSRYRSQESQENLKWKTAPKAVRSGTSSRRCLLTHVSSG
jgi:hypothetical protein